MFAYKDLLYNYNNAKIKKKNQRGREKKKKTYLLNQDKYRKKNWYNNDNNNNITTTATNNKNNNKPLRSTCRCCIRLSSLLTNILHCLSPSHPNTYTLTPHHPPPLDVSRIELVISNLIKKLSDVRNNQIVTL